MGAMTPLIKEQLDELEDKARHYCMPCGPDNVNTILTNDLLSLLDMARAYLNTADALVSLADAAELVGEKLFIIQPFFDVYKKHGETIAAVRAGRKAGRR
jgi:hypothetical protein